MGRTITSKQEQVLNTMCYGANQVLLGTLLKELLEKSGTGGGGGTGEENVIEKITIAGIPLEVKDKTVEIPAATAQTLGLVKSGSSSGDIVINEDGTMSVKKIKLSAIEQDEVLVLDGGNADT